MASKRQLIEVDETTATRLRERADAQGISVAEVVAGLTALAESPVEISPKNSQRSTGNGRRFSLAKREWSLMIRSRAGSRLGARRTTSRFR